MSSKRKNDSVEKWAEKHHGKLELARTCLAVFSATISCILLLRMMGKF